MDATVTCASIFAWRYWCFMERGTLPGSCREAWMFMKMVPLVKEKEVLFIPGIIYLLFYLCIILYWVPINILVISLQKQATPQTFSNKLYPSKNYCLEINSSTNQSCKYFQRATRSHLFLPFWNMQWQLFLKYYLSQVYENYSFNESFLSVLANLYGIWKVLVVMICWFLLELKGRDQLYTTCKRIIFSNISGSQWYVSDTGFYFSFSVFCPFFFVVDHT